MMDRWARWMGRGEEGRKATTKLPSTVDAVRRDFKVEEACSEALDQPINIAAHN